MAPTKMVKPAFNVNSDSSPINPYVMLLFSITFPKTTLI